MKKNNFVMNMNDFHLVEKDGLPEDGEWCVMIFGEPGHYAFSVGSYSQTRKRFWADMGFGGMVLDAQDCIAWKSFDEITVDIDE